MKKLYHNSELITIASRILLRISLDSNIATDHPADFVGWPVAFIFIKSRIDAKPLKTESLSLLVNLSLTNPALMGYAVALIL